MKQEEKEETSYLGAAEGKYRILIEGMNEGVIVVDNDDVIQYVNDRLCEMFGYLRQELLGKVAYQIFLDEKDHDILKERNRQRVQGLSERYEVEMKRKSGEKIWTLNSAAPISTPNGAVIGSFAIITDITERKLAEENERRRWQLELENAYLREEVQAELAFGEVVGKSQALCKVIRQVEMVAPTDASVLIQGESGTGKELIARAIHNRSKRSHKAMVKVNCGAIPKELFESEFFGHIKGAFTGALKDRTGRFELADGGTLFLDEISEIPLELQSKLLRVLQEGQFERVGDERTRQVNVRIIAATNRNLKGEVEAGRFREDLFYRLSVFPIDAPPLRERREDVPLLAEHFIASARRRLNCPKVELRPEHIQQLQGYDWPGNVRELQNVIERAVIVSRCGQLRLDLALPDTSDTSDTDTDLALASKAGFLSEAEVKLRERDNIISALKKANWKVFGPGGAAELLGVKPTTLAYRIKKMKLKKTDSSISPTLKPSILA